MKITESVSVPSLSERELEILRYIARGWSNKRIANLLGISHQTVKNRVSVILTKLQVKDRSQAVIYAVQQGWIRLSEISDVNRS
jgi:DNA-binding NarL/FixJ family response regulator